VKRHSALVMATLLVSCCAAALHAASPVKCLIVDGRNNHDWKTTTPMLRQALEESGRFKVDVATAAPGREGVEAFAPKFKKYKVVVLNYTDFNDPSAAWPDRLKSAFADYVRKGGGVVVIHASASAFGGWPEFDEIIGLGGWGGRSEKTGPMLRFRDGSVVRDMIPGPAGHHGKQHQFVITTRIPDHPIMRGLPPAWLHAKDELYDKLRGPAKNLDLLATTYSDPAQGGTGENEPALFTVRYGKGRTFHTILGHAADPMMRCVGFRVTLARGAEWAATGKVTQQVPKDFPTAGAVSLRP
jgi:uncharacterized protein